MFYSQKLKTLSNNVAVPIINKNDFGEYKIPIATQIAEQQKIGKILSNIDSQIEQKKKIHSKLVQLKRGQMQKLLTGKIRVKV